MYPNDYRYTKEHEWVKVEGDVAKVGITNYAQHELGDVVYVDLPKIGARLRATEPLGTVESVKAVSDSRNPPSRRPRLRSADACRKIRTWENLT